MLCESGLDAQFFFGSFGYFFAFFNVPPSFRDAVMWERRNLSGGCVEAPLKFYGTL